MSVWTELSAKDLNNGKKGIIPKYLCFGDKNVPDCKISFHYLLCQYLPNPLASLFFLVSPPIKLAGTLGVVAANTNPTKGTQQEEGRGKLDLTHRDEDLADSCNSDLFFYPISTGQKILRPHL